MTDDDDEVQRLKSLVKDLELQNTALRSLKQESHTEQHQEDHHQLKNSVAGRKRQSLSSESDGDPDFLDLSLMSSLDEDASWLFSSPHKQGQSSSPSADQLKRKMLAAFESPEILPRRRALSHKLKDIEKGSPTVQSLFALRNSAATAPVQSSEYETYSSSQANSFNSSFNRDEEGYSTAPSSSSLHTPDDYQGSYTNGATSYQGPSAEAPAMKPLLSDIHASSSTNPNTAYNTGTFTRPKKRQPVAPLHSAHKSDNDTDTDEPLPADTPIPLVNIQPPIIVTSNHSDESNYAKPSNESRNRNDMGAGDSSTFVRRRNQTRTIESSAVLEAQRLLTDSPSSLEQSENDSLGALPDESFRRRDPTGNTEDRSKRESLDIQTLAKLQEQSLRDSLSAVRKASTSSAGSGGVPSLNFSDLDSSTGSLSSSNEESFGHRAEENSMQGSGTFRIRKSPRTKTQSPTLELNGDTPIIHKSVVNSGNGTNNAALSAASSGRQSPLIRSSLSPRSIQVPKASGLRKPKSSLPAASKVKPRTTGGIPAPRSGLRPPTNTQYNSTR